MKNFGFIKTVSLFGTIFFISCSGSNQTIQESKPEIPSYQIVGEVGSERVTYDELVENFSAGNINSEYTLQEVKDFLPVYLDYRAKIQSAQDDGYFDDQRILDEYAIYSKQAAYSFWLENKIRPTLFNEFKSKYSSQLKSSHILIAVPETATIEDTAKVYNDLIEAREKYANGTTMADLDVEYSTKRNGRSMGGDLPWFSLGSTVKEFENVLYGLEVGELSKPFRTQFGYHIVLLEDKRERKSSREISHIFARGEQGEAKLDSALIDLTNGDDWNEVVLKYTQDKPSASNGGKIGSINYGGRYNGDFIDSVMTLDTSLPFSNVVPTSYGYHIFKIDSIQSFKNEAEKDAFLMKELEDSRNFRKSNSFVINWLRNNYKEIENDSLLKKLVGSFKSIDSTTVEEFRVTESMQNQEIYTFDKYSYKTSDFMNYLIEKKKGAFTNSYVYAWFNEFKEFNIDDKLTELTISELPEFIPQTESYKSGLVVYQLNEDSLWSAATVDTSKLEEIYYQDLATYSFDTRYFYHLITSSRDTSLQNAIDFVNMGNPPDSIRSNGIAVGVVSDSTGSFQGAPFDKLETMQVGTFSDVFEYNTRNGVFYLNKILPARTMTFEEAFNRLMADYQPTRESMWLNRLRTKYSIKEYQENVDRAYQLKQ